MRRASMVLFALLALSGSVAGVDRHDPDRHPIRFGSELLEWCRMESQARFIGENRQAFNWTARHFERGNELRVEGQWRVDGDRYVVECRVARGAWQEYATLAIRKA